MKQLEYNENGPVWIAQSYETTDECAPESRVAWKVQDMDDHVIAWDCSEENARSIVQSLNTHGELFATLNQILIEHFGDIHELRAHIERHGNNVKFGWRKMLAVLDKIPAAPR